jgi:hypothetical protein
MRRKDEFSADLTISVAKNKYKPHASLPQCNNIFERFIGIVSILDELNTFFFQNCYLKLVPMNFDEEY